MKGGGVGWYLDGGRPGWNGLQLWLLRVEVAVEVKRKVDCH